MVIGDGVAFGCGSSNNRSRYPLGKQGWIITGRSVLSTAARRNGSIETGFRLTCVDGSEAHR